MTREDQFLGLRILESLDSTDKLIEFTDLMLTHGFDYALEEFKRLYSSIIYSNLYEDSNLKPNLVQDIYNVYDDDSIIHVIVDSQNFIIHVNSDKLRNINNAVKTLFELGYVLKRKELRKSKSVFKKRFYRAYDTGIPTYPIVYS